LGQVPQNGLDEIWNGERMRKLRREFLDGNPVSCRQQMKHVKCHKWSRRDYTHALPLKEVLPGGPLRLDVRLNGKCNLQCVMCDVWKQPNGLYDQSNFWSEGPEKIFPYLKEIDVLGGEPFVQSDTYRLIDEVSAVNRDCSWAFVTNGSYILGPQIKRRLDNINIRWLQVSLDSVNPATYPKIRLRGDLSKVLQTLNHYRDYCSERVKIGRGFYMLIAMCVQRLNWREIHEFLAFARRLDMTVQLQFAYKPDSASLLTLSESERQEVLESLIPVAREFGAAAINPVALPLAESLGYLLAPMREPNL
jgi:cyclic pyranopterin phosphate synthase